jgi:hypothetical protein
MSLLKNFLGTDTINEVLYTASLIILFKSFIILIFKLDKIIIRIEINNNVNNENFCLFSFFKNADLRAMTKSSLLEAIRLNTR